MKAFPFAGQRSVVAKRSCPLRPRKYGGENAYLRLLARKGVVSFRKAVHFATKPVRFIEKAVEFSRPLGSGLWRSLRCGISRAEFRRKKVGEQGKEGREDGKTKKDRFKVESILVLCSEAGD